MAQRQFKSTDTDKWYEGFGSGVDGNLTISGNTTDAPIDSACTGTAGTKTLTATNASFAGGQIIMIHQTKGTGIGNWELNKIASYVAGTITLAYKLMNTYSSGAQVLVIERHDTVTINSGVSLTAKAYNGTVGGIVVLMGKTAIDVNGTVNADATGFRGGDGTTGNLQVGYAGENQTVTYNGTRSVSRENGSGGGGGQGSAGSYSSGGGGGGGNGTAGTAGGNGQSPAGGGQGGTTDGGASLVDMVFGGAGGQGGGLTNTTPGAGGDGGGIIFLISPSIDVDNSTGILTTDGQNGANGTTSAGQVYAGGGGGAGGSILIKGQTVALGTNRLGATAGTGGTGNGAGGNSGGAGGVGRFHVDYKTSFSGSSSPTIDTTQDATIMKLPRPITETFVNQV